MADKQGNESAFSFKENDIVNIRGYIKSRGASRSGMSLRAYAAIKLRVPDSGLDWLDEMIRKSLRDKFAGQALAGYEANPVSNERTPEESAYFAFDWADSMLAEREEKS